MTARAKKRVCWGFRGLAFLVCVATLLPLFRTNEWWVRIFDFPRMQVACLGIVLLAPALIWFKHLRAVDRVLAALVAAAVGAQVFQIYPYTPLAAAQVIRARESGETLKVFSANVLQGNHRTNTLLELIAQEKPDVVLLMETDPWWARQLAGLEREFPYSIKEPLTNTYGMILYSKLDLVNPEVRYLVQPDIPSIRTDVRLRDGRTVRVYGVHPRPPGRPGRTGAPADSAPRDAELVIVAKEVRGLEQPVIVAGDFNDVAWSHTTRLFQRVSRLLDPRIGRGFFNTYNANYWFLRFPLDHLFHSDDFAMVDFKRLPYIGSDHFPILSALRLSRAAPGKQEAPPLKPSDPAEARETIREGAQN